METRYQIVGRNDVDPSNFMTLDELSQIVTPVMPGGPRTYLRRELQNAPGIAGLCGPMWGGWYDENREPVWLVDDYDPEGARPSYCRTDLPIAIVVVRYETQEACDMLSR